MKNICILILLLLFLSDNSQAQVKIGVIDTQEIIQKSNKGLAIRVKLEMFQNKKQDELKIIQNEIQKLEKEIQSPALNNEIREQKANELQSKRTNLQRDIENAKRDIANESDKSLLQLESEVSPIINSYGKNNGFTVIYDISRSGIVYFDNAISITNDIIKFINEK